MVYSLIQKPYFLCNGAGFCVKDWTVFLQVLFAALILFKSLLLCRLSTSLFYCAVFLQARCSFLLTTFDIPSSLSATNYFPHFGQISQQVPNFKNHAESTLISPSSICVFLPRRNQCLHVDDGLVIINYYLLSGNPVNTGSFSLLLTKLSSFIQNTFTRVFYVPKKFCLEGFSTHPSTYIF